MGKCKHWQFCESNFEERGAGNPHATICGGWNRVNGSFYPAKGVRTPFRLGDQWSWLQEG